MGKIYSSANLVWAFLGENMDDNIELRSLLMRASSRMKLDISTLRSSASSLRSILERDYFSRVWIIQEFTLAKRVAFICGFLYFSSSVVIRSTNELSRKSRNIFSSELQPPVPNQASALFKLRSDYIEGREHWPLVRILSYFRGRACMRARDHLFALLSLADDASNPDLDPNYDEPIEQTVRRYAEVFVKNGYVMELLSLAGHDPEPVECLRFPSWIPDWTLHLPAVAECVEINHDRYQVGINPTSCKVVGNILQLNGRLIDQVSDLQNSWSTGISIWTPMEFLPLEQYAEIFGSLFDDICRVSGICPYIEGPLDYFPPLRQRIRQHQGSGDSSTSPTAETNPGTSLMDLIQILPASAHLERLRSFFELREPNDEWFAWLATCFAKYRSWRAYRISIGLSLSLDSNPLPNRHEDHQKDTDDSSEFDSDVYGPPTYGTYLIKKRQENLTKDERCQFVKNLRVSENERESFYLVQFVIQTHMHLVLYFFLHIFRVWRVFKTKSGKIGIGPLRTRIGDRLYMTEMSKKPIVLRKIEGKEGLYQFVAVAEMSSMEFEDDEDLNEVLRIR